MTSIAPKKREMTMYQYQKGLTGFEIFVIIVIIVVIVVLGFGSQSGDQRTATQDNCDEGLRRCEAHCKADPFASCLSQCDSDFKNCSAIVSAGDTVSEALRSFEETLETTGEHTACTSASRMCLNSCLVVEDAEDRPADPHDIVGNMLDDVLPRKEIRWNAECVADCRESNLSCEAGHGHGFVPRMFPTVKLSNIESIPDSELISQ